MLVPGIVIVPLMMPRFEPGADRGARFCATPRMFEPVARGLRSWCRRRRSGRSPMLRALPLHAELGGAARGDLDDERLDVDLRAALVELVDHGAQRAVDGLGRGDDDRVGGRVGLDRSSSARPLQAAAVAEVSGVAPRAAHGRRRRRARACARLSAPPASSAAQRLGDLGRPRRCAGTRCRCCRCPRPACRGRARAPSRAFMSAGLSARTIRLLVRVSTAIATLGGGAGRVGRRPSVSGTTLLQDLRDVDGRGVLQRA